MSFLDALRLANQISSLGRDAAPTLTALVGRLKNQDPQTQRVALDAAFAATEDAIAAQIRKKI